MFIVGAAFGLVQSIPVLLNANASADRIAQLEALLQRNRDLDRAEPDRGAETRFDKIEVRDLMFRYVDKFSDTAFQIGPIDFTLKSGELVFITGGNGSGKSTFLRVLSGLYPPDSGEITLDGMRVDGNTRDTYRALMSAIFFDYHLFRRLYGVSEPDPGEVDRLLAKFRLADKTGLNAERRIPHARPVRRSAPAPRAHRQHAGKAANPHAGRVDGGTRSRIPAQVLR